MAIVRRKASTSSLPRPENVLDISPIWYQDFMRIVCSGGTAWNQCSNEWLVEQFNKGRTPLDVADDCIEIPMDHFREY